jgi:RNase P subunit RPR2
MNRKINGGNIHTLLGVMKETKGLDGCDHDFPPESQRTRRIKNGGICLRWTCSKCGRMVYYAKRYSSGN